MPISGKATVTGSKINYLGKALSSEKNLVPNTLDERVWRVDLAAVKIKGDFSLAAPFVSRVESRQ
jgi:hypothetical protein